MNPGAGERPRWTRSLLIALAAHGGVVAAALWLQTPAPPPAGVAMDAILVELAAAPQAPPSPSREVAPGVAQQQSEPRPARTPPTPEPTPEQPSQSAKPVAQAVMDNPHVANPEPASSVSASAAEPTQGAAQASAPPSVDAPRSDTYAAPRTLSGNSRQPVESWHGVLLGHLERHRRYPRQAERLGQQGVSYIRFDVDHHGHVANSEIARGSGNSMLDAEALATVSRASPVPPPPDTPPGTVTNVVVPVDFFISR